MSVRQPKHRIPPKLLGHKKFLNINLKIIWREFPILYEVLSYRLHFQTKGGRQERKYLGVVVEGGGCKSDAILKMRHTHSNTQYKGSLNSGLRSKDIILSNHMKIKVLYAM